ncbi:30515_t:CDS:2, partial [Racocetra persica]
WNWDEKNADWLRNGPTKCALKRIENSNQMRRSVVDCFGITREPTGCYMFVMRLCDENLYQYIDKSMGYLRWECIAEMLRGIIDGLKRIHDNGLYHGNLHGGNLLIEFTPGGINIRISDIGLHVPHDLNLAKSICNGLRPEIINNTPEAYSTLMKRCWHQDSNKRPKVTELSNILNRWVTAIYEDPISNLLNAENNDRVRSENFIFTNRRIHPKAIYTSQLLSFQSLPDDA